MSDPEQAARELAGLLTTCPTVAHLSTPAMGEEFTPHIMAFLRSREEAAFKEGGLAAMVDQEKLYASAWKEGAEAMRGKILDELAFPSEEEIRALPIPERKDRCDCNGDYPCDGAHR